MNAEHAVADPGFAKGGWTMASVEREHKRALPPAGSRGRAPRGDQGEAALKLKAFCTFSYKKVART